MKQTLLERLETALYKGSVELHNTVKKLDGEGFSQLEILDAYYQLWDMLREEGRETDEDTVENEIEMIVGFCSPHLKQEFTRPYTQAEYSRYMRQRSNRWKGKIEL